jgi:hypothetical protein
VLAVYQLTGARHYSENLVACDNDGAGDQARSLLRFDAVAGGQYRAFVDGVNGARGGVHLSWRMGYAPSFVSHGPVTQAVRNGQRLRLGADLAGGTGAIHFQWLRNGAMLLGETNAVLEVVVNGTTLGSSYRVMAQSEFGQSMSDETTVELGVPYLTVEVVAGARRVWANGPSGTTLRVDRSSDLANWQEWWTVTTTGQRLSHDFVPQGATAQFFRAVPMSQ